jgi:hypothetical protein
MRGIGFVRARELLQLFDAADLEANPRSAKAGQVTDDIIESIEDTPEIFVFKTKGILIGASSYERLQRNRYRLVFENTKIEGILDGGHNALAIGTHILVAATGDEAVKRKARRWSDFKDLWAELRDEIETLRKIKPGEDGYDSNAIDFLVPIEVLVPSDPEDEDAVARFNASLLSICSARNNNVQLTLETKAAKKGFYEDLQKALPQKISERVEWKSNDGGDIKVRDLIALTWIPLSALKLDYVTDVLPQNIYRNKGECAKLFDELMSDDRVSKPTSGEYTRAVHNKSIKSALSLAGELPELYDKIYKDFPAAYNDEGRFGKLAIVKMAKAMKTKPTSHFTEMPVDYSYPDGLIMPLVYGLKVLMKSNEEGMIEWTHDPVKFLDKNLSAIVRKYRVILDAYGFDPQKVGKSQGSYELVIDAYKTALMLQKDR